MMKWNRLLSPLFVIAAVSLPATADEGMWLFNHLPKETLKQNYGADITPEFLDNLRLASARLGNSTASFVSANGLLLTNQHLVATCLAALSSSSHNYLKDGFYAAAPDQEKRCPDLSVQLLMGIEDLPAPEGKPKHQNECFATTGETCQIVSLFSGSRYQVYKYKPITDVRLVFAPEQQLAFFGHEHDSITYLRYGLDIAFLRAYENGRPVATPHFLKWSNSSIKEGDLVFTSGNPQATVRETTAAQLTFYRDTALPLELERLSKRIAALNEFGAESEANRRRADTQRIALLETYKSAAGKLIGLRDDRLVLRKTVFDAKIRRAVEADSKLGTQAGKVWDQVATAYKNWAPHERAYRVLEADPAPASNLFRIARAGLRNEPKGNSNDVPPALEITFIAQYLDELKYLSEHGEKDVPVKAILTGRTTRAAAEDLVRSEGGLLHLAQLLEPAAQRIRKKHDEIIGTVETSAASQIAQYRYRLFGDAEYPDGTGTPRLEYGVIKSYTDRAGVDEPYAASFSGLYYRENNQGPYQVPQRWIDAKLSLDSVTPLDFVSTCDLGGGDRGSPTVNQKGELIGVLFDGNLESLPGTYLYTGDQARSVHVAAEGIAESLAKVYHADSLLHELGLPARETVNP